MRQILTLATILGTAGVTATFLLFFLLVHFGFPPAVIQSMLFLKLIVAGHSTLYVTRSKSWFWRKPWPSPLLLTATFSTEIVATFIAVYGFLISPIGWKYAIWMWLYALGDFIVNDVIKMWVHRTLPGQGDD
jgi:H+-transporting ATPase